MAEDTNKQQLWACTFIIVCAGEQGENVIQQAKLLEKKEDYTKILDVLDEFVSPSTYFVEDSVNYFYLKQGEMSVSHYQAAAEQLIERMIPHLTPCSSNDNKLFRRSGSLLLIQHYIYKRHCINCNVQLHSTIAVKDTNRYELHFKQFMLITLIGKYCNKYNYNNYYNNYNIIIKCALNLVSHT